MGRSRIPTGRTIDWMKEIASFSASGMEKSTSARKRCMKTSGPALKSRLAADMMFWPAPWVTILSKRKNCRILRGSTSTRVPDSSLTSAGWGSRREIPPSSVPGTGDPIAASKAQGNGSEGLERQAVHGAGQGSRGVDHPADLLVPGSEGVADLIGAGEQRTARVGDREAV